MLEEFRFGKRPFHRFFQAIFDLQQATDFIPTDLGNLDVNFSQSGRLDVSDGFLEVVHAHFHFLKHFGRERLFVKVNLGQVAAERSHGGLSNQGCEVSADKAVGVVEHPTDVKVLSNGHLTGVDIHDFAATFSIGHTDLNLSVKAARSSQGRVECIPSVGGSNDHDVVSALHAVHQGQHLSDDSTFNLSGDVLTLGAYGIDFVDEHDGGGVVGGLIKDFAQLLFGFTVVFRDDFRPVDALEVSVGFRGDGFGDHGLPGSRRAVKKHAFGRVDAETAEQFWVLERQFDHLTHFEKLLTDAAHVFVGDALGLAHVLLGNRFVLDDDLGVRGDHDDAFGHGLNDSEGKGFGEQGHAGNENSVAGDHRALGEASLGEAFDSGPKLDLLLVGHDGGDGQFGAGFSIHLSDGHTVAQADTGVLSDDPVHSDDVHLGVFGTAAPVNGGRGALFTADLNKVAWLEVKAHFR